MNQSKPINSIRVVHGANDDTFDVAGATVADIQSNLSDAFNLPAGVRAFVNGVGVAAGRRMNGGDVLEFVVQAGRKGLGKLLSPDELMNAWGIDQAQYEAWLAEGLPTERLVTGSPAHFELAVDEWSRGRARVRPSKNPPPLRSKWLRLKDAAALLGVSTRQLARYADQGRIAHKRKPGRGRGGNGEYLFSPEEIERFNARTTRPARMDKTLPPRRQPAVRSKVFIDPTTCGRSVP